MGQNTFDIVSEVNMQEVDNAVNQTKKEIAQRYDFKDSKTIVELSAKEKEIVVTTENDFRLKAVIDILQNKLIKRGIHIKALTYHAVEPAAGGNVRQKISLQVGIEKENAKLIVKMIKETKLKVQAQIMDDQVRVSGKDRDELQSVIALLKNAELSFAVQFTNYRSS
ncbi:MAG: YajQ family cyclic di-GMP-binding protein [Bacteroidota bacterium]|nr:YajQ family cyclic di-GMP-binding protein [Bacteroidota bacterium]